MALTVAWQYIGGQVRAADSRDERRVEWPPHPGRVWLALAAQWFGGCPSAEEQAEGQAALEALRQAPEPQLWIPSSVGLPRHPVGVYVPVNDTAEGNTQFGDSPVGRIRQERFFPALHVGEEEVCALHWPDLALPDHLVTALENMVQRLCYLGQSTSLIRAWVWKNAVPPPGTIILETLSGGDESLWYLRGFGGGFSLAELARWYAAGKTPVPRGWIPYGLRERIPDSPRPINGRGNDGDESRENGVGSPSTPWGTDLTFFLQTSGMVVPITDILAVVYGLRQELRRRCPLPLPTWLTGYTENSEPVRQNTWYMGCFPVAHLGVEGSNGRLMGIALARPKTISKELWDATLAPLMSPAGFPVTLPGGGRMVFQHPLQSVSGVFHEDLWTGGGQGSEIWATTTPMVLDQLLPAHSGVSFERRIAMSISYSCQLAGLPEPVQVIARREPWWAGSFPAWARDNQERSFPPDWRFQRRQLPRFHIWVRFPVPVRGPLALGRLRFQGYGVFWAVESHITPPHPEMQLGLRFRRNASRPKVHLVPGRQL